MRKSSPLMSILAIVGGMANFAAAAEPVKETAPFGLETRIPWTTSHVVGAPEPPSPYLTEKVFPRLKIFQPLTFEIEPGRKSYLVIQHLGSWSAPAKILRVADDPQADSYDTILEIPGIALGLDYHPDYLNNGYIFVGHNSVIEGVHKTRVSRFTVDKDPPHHIDPKSEYVIIDWDSNGHDGGDVAFGGDGMLYVTSGDGTSDSDRNNRGQELTHLTAKILRIDVDHPDAGRAYSVPKDNPFLSFPGARPETWAYGLRNPWRLSYDKVSGQLWCGNNGQDLWETTYCVTKGANYGWSAFEGSHEFLNSRKIGPTPHTPPTTEHHHSESRSLTGGLVYQGDKLPELKGAYVYGDWSTGKIWAVKVVDDKVQWLKEIVDTTFQITGFGIDFDGNLIVIDHQTAFHKLVPRPVVADKDQPKFPAKLSETGIFKSLKDRKPEAGLIPYSVNAPLWSDGAYKERMIAVPGEEKVGYKDAWGWDFPNGTVLVKTFLYDIVKEGRATRQPIETRLMTRQDNEWVGYSYAWNDDQTDAFLVTKEGVDKDFQVRPVGQTEGVRTQRWHFPSRAECMVCHSRAASYVLGLTEVQMNKDHDYGGVVDNQLRALDHIGFFKTPLAKKPSELPHLVDPFDGSIDLEKRVKSYVHSNCASCHVEAGGGNAAIDLSLQASLKSMGLGVVPSQDHLGIKDARIIAPGSPEQSTLFQRISRRGPGQMPPVGTNLVDENAVKLLREWITQVHTPKPAEAKPSE
ncbi:PQQ-dependent sugar dehydrogenase [Singulisphaera sp. PoT]|uniref:PQQ-dependent sugar dehydrogenase n=1 Tax=Singulisphaera sp. PoT TaxID=3411797 RepID=UPI003BF48A3D